MVKKISVYIDGANFYGGLTSLNKNFSDLNFDFENCSSRILLNQANKINLVNKKITNKFFYRETEENKSNLT